LKPPVGDHPGVFDRDSAVGHDEMKAVEDAPRDDKAQQVTAGEPVDCDLDLPACPCVTRRCVCSDAVPGSPVIEAVEIAAA
jgi:hypothetical protein